jgi:hypothetical protein
MMQIVVAMRWSRADSWDVAIRQTEFFSLIELFFLFFFDFCRIFCQNMFFSNAASGRND